MSSDAPKIPPPAGYVNWLDYGIGYLRRWSYEWSENARDELAALRQRLADTEALLATARETLAALDEQRKKAERERDQFRAALSEVRANLDGGPCQTTAKCDGCKYEWRSALHVACNALAVPMRFSCGKDRHDRIDAKIKELATERDAALAKLAELREAALALDGAVLKGFAFAGDDEDLASWNALVAKLREEEEKP